MQQNQNNRHYKIKQYNPSTAKHFKSEFYQSHIVLSRDHNTQPDSTRQKSHIFLSVVKFWTTEMQHILELQTVTVQFFRAHNISTMWKKYINIFLSYLPQNLVDSDKIWYTLSWLNLRYSSWNVFHLTWIMSLQYLVKLSIRIL